MTLITNVNPNYVRDYKSSAPSQARSPIDPNIVARVQPRASKGHHGPVIATLFHLLKSQGVPIRTLTERLRQSK